MKALKVKDFNLLKAPYVSPDKKPSGKKVWRVLLLPVLLLVLGLGWFAAIKIQTFLTMREIRTLQQSVTELRENSDYQTALEAETELSFLNTGVQNMQIIRQMMDSYPVLDSSMFGAITGAMGEDIAITGYAYTASDGSLAITGRAESVTSSSAFVSRLRQTGLFSAISYSGYLSGQTADGTGYSFQVTCILNEREASDK